MRLCSHGEFYGYRVFLCFCSRCQFLLEGTLREGFVFCALSCSGLLLMGIYAKITVEFPLVVMEGVHSERHEIAWAKRTIRAQGTGRPERSR